MADLYDALIVVPGKQALFFLLVAFILTFLFIRFSVRMIRAGVSWWPGNITSGDVHIHHVVFGTVLMAVAPRELHGVAPYGAHCRGPRRFAKHRELTGFGLGWLARVAALLLAFILAESTWAGIAQKLEVIFFGAGSLRSRRSGTHPTAAAIGFTRGIEH